MNRILNRTLLVSSLALIMSPAAYATNGLAPTGLGQIHKAMGGAAVGNPENTMTMATNPAAASFIDDGFDVGLELFVPVREVSFAGTTYDGNGTAAFAIPEGGYKRTLSNGLSFGLTAYGNGGMNTDYKPAFPVALSRHPAATEVGIDFKQVFISPTISKKIGDNHSVGLAINLVGQTFKSKGAFTPGSTGTDTATGIGATLGWMGKISPRTIMGFSHRFKTSMGGFSENAPLFAGATAGTVIDGSLGVPGATTLGLSFKASKKTKIAIDLQRIHYSKIKIIKDGFGWDDQDIIKVGVKHQLNNNVALMAGLNYGKSVITSANAHRGTLAPAVSDMHISFGADVKMSKNSSLSLSYVHAFENSVISTVSGAEVRMAQDAIGIGYSRTF